MTKSAKPPVPRRGEVWLVDFDPTVGAEIQKTRPALVLQNDIGNRYSAITIVAAITSDRGGPVRPIQVRIPSGQAGLDNNSLVVLNQIRSIDKQRLVRRLGTIKPDAQKAVDRAVAISLGLIASP